jgi:hypothetical protein
VPKSQHRAWLAQLRRLIKESRKLTPRELLSPCTINQFKELVPLNELVPLRNEIHECFERIGPLVGNLYAEESEIPWDSFNLRLGDYLSGKKKFEKPEDIIIFKRGIRASTRILIQAARRIQKEIEGQSGLRIEASTPEQQESRSLTKAEESGTHKAPAELMIQDRLPGSIGTPQAVQAVQNYIHWKGLSRAQFASRCGTSAKTLGKFFNTRKVRISIFQDMAKTMGISPEQLLKGEVPPLETR